MRIKFIIAALPAALAAGGCMQSTAHEDRLRQVASAGERVMPFDLERSTHTFADAAWGGAQTVVSDDGDEAQIALIRSHLAAEAVRFARGDFGSPESIHGHDMPGLAVLREKYAALDVAYVDVPGGGEITYRTQDAGAVEAIHLWFAAQRSDHGRHAAH
jgi:hypothetical protein